MSDMAGGKEDIEVLREVLFKPLYEQNKDRDKKLVQFVEQFGAKLTARLRELENRVDLLAAELDKRESMVSGIGQGIASLGQELRQLASRAESFQVTPGSRKAVDAEKIPVEEHQTQEPMPQAPETQFEAEPDAGPEPQSPDSAEDEWDETESESQDAARDEWDEPEPQNAASDEPDEPEPRETASDEQYDPESQSQSQEPATADIDDDRPRLRKSIRREPVQATLPSRGFG